MRAILNEKSISLKFEKMLEKAESKAMEMVLSVGATAVNLSPIDTAAFVESWSIVPKGSGAGRRKSSKTPERLAVSGKISEGEKMAIKQRHIETALKSDMDKYKEQLVSSGGAVIRNRAPHADPVERKYGILSAAVRDNFR